MTTLQKIVGGMIAVAIVFGLGYGTATYTQPAKVVVDEQRVEQLATQLAQIKVEQIVSQRIEDYKQTHKEEFTITKWKKVTVAVPCPYVPPPPGGCQAPCAVDCNKCPKQIITIESGSNNTGTNTTNTSGTNTTNTNSNTSTNTTVNSTSTATTNTHTETTYSKPQWLFSAKAGLNTKNITSQTLSEAFIWGGEGNKRLVGPVWMGVWGYSNLTFGLSLSLEL